jgi:hypothetical protein
MKRWLKDISIFQLGVKKCRENFIVLILSTYQYYCYNWDINKRRVGVPLIHGLSTRGLNKIPM